MDGWRDEMEFLSDHAPNSSFVFVNDDQIIFDVIFCQFCKSSQKFLSSFIHFHSIKLGDDNSRMVA